MARLSLFANNSFARAAVAAVATFAVMAAQLPSAAACGCTSPPVPTLRESSYAVNQQSEQIIFEVEDGFVTAHVLIRYAGDPSQFAWIVPVPAAPDLDLSESAMFGMLDRATAPTVAVGTRSLCPDPDFRCAYHPMPECADPMHAVSSSASAGPGPGSGGGFGGGGGASGMGQIPGGVEVIATQQIGSYDTVVFAAGDAQAAVNWLQTEGFIVNDTMTPYMQPYLDDNMLFVAAKLIPGAGADEIKPLKMRYAAAAPMIPLQLTAVAAEPNLTVTTYIFSDQTFGPDGLPLVDIQPEDISVDLLGRANYPMVVARAIDDVGGHGFVREYQSVVPSLPFQTEPCCGDAGDSCFIGGDAVCQCPNQEFDAEDCAEPAGLLDAVADLEELQQKHAYVTRLTTRLSPEEMTIDPGFVGTGTINPSGRLELVGERLSLEACVGDVIDQGAYDDALARQSCASVYCGTGQCVATEDGPGCLCDVGSVARVFNDLDEAPSVTCVPEINTVDFGAGSEIQLPSACDGVQCGAGSCIDVGGFPTCDCDAGKAAVVQPSSVVPACGDVQLATGTRGARDYSDAIEPIAVCAPAPPTCGEWGWLEPRDDQSIKGVTCESSLPDPDQLVAGPAPTCTELGLFPLPDGESDDESGPVGCGCGVLGRGGDQVPLLLLGGMLLALGRRRRRD
jgi:Uncharacterized protein conserved in bacteria (DUF2330)